ncbi:SGNH hydrolase [Peniophora sp. CONT]|nr:SGNH hydrolase [Peniophora sp. CONT]
MAAIYDTVVLFGDSITQGAWDHGGFGAQLAHAYARRFDVLNRGFSGYNTEWALPIADTLFPAPGSSVPTAPVRLLTIWFGANDACLKPSPQHVPLDRFRSNLHTLIARAPSGAAVVLITAPPVNTIQRGADLSSRDPPKELDRSFEVTRQYAELVKEVGKEKGVPVVDVWTALWEAVGKEEKRLEEVLSDGLHLNATGYNALVETLERELPELKPEMSWRNFKHPTWDWFSEHGFEGWEERKKQVP